MVGSARKRGTASNVLAMRRGTVGPPATTVSANLSHLKLVIAQKSQVFHYALQLSNLRNAHTKSVGSEEPQFVVVSPE